MIKLLDKFFKKHFREEYEDVYYYIIGVLLMSVVAIPVFILDVLP